MPGEHRGGAAVGAPRFGELAQAGMKVVTTPPGASIKIDGDRALDPSPTTIALKPGAHKVEVSLADYEAASRDVTVPAGGSVEVKIDLKALPAPPPPPPVVASTPVSAAPSSPPATRTEMPSGV